MNLGPSELKELTLRQLIWMTEGRDRHTWSIASSLMALIANCHKEARGKSFEPDDFNPTLSKAERNSKALLITDDNVDIMRGEFKRAMSGDITLIPIEEEEDEKDG